MSKKTSKKDAVKALEDCILSIQNKGKKKNKTPKDKDKKSSELNKVA